MATSFETIEDFAFVTIKDYKLDRLYKENPADWSIVVAGILARAALDFPECQTDLTVDLEKKEFTGDLSQREINILVYLFIDKWIEGVANNLSRNIPTMVPQDAKRTSLPATMKEIQYKLDIAREKNSQRITEYCWDNAPFQQWANGNFF